MWQPMPDCIDADFSGISPVLIDLHLTLLLKNIVVRYYWKANNNVYLYLDKQLKINIPNEVYRVKWLLKIYFLNMNELHDWNQFSSTINQVFCLANINQSITTDGLYTLLCENKDECDRLQK